MLPAWRQTAENSTVATAIAAVAHCVTPLQEAEVQRQAAARHLAESLQCS